MFDCFVYIRQDATQSYLEVLFYSIGAFNELQECSFKKLLVLQRDYLMVLGQKHGTNYLPYTYLEMKGTKKENQTNCSVLLKIVLFIFWTYANWKSHFEYLLEESCFPEVSVFAIYHLSHQQYPVILSCGH